MLVLQSRKIAPVALGVLLLLSGCNFGSSSSPKTPTGQVVATVGSREITRRELQAEMAGSTATTPAAQKAEQQLALRRIIQRVILANAAKEQGLDKDPNFALLSQRADESILAQLLENKTAAAVPAPSNEEVQQFQETNPNLFAERKVFDVDQIRITRPSDPQLAKKLEPLKTLADIADYLNQNHIIFQRGPNTIDSLGQSPDLLKAIMVLPPHEPFILASANEIFVSEITNTRVVPLTGDTAAKYAQNMLKSQHVRDAVVRQLNIIVGKASRTVKVAKEFEPPPKKPPAKPQPQR
jgi:EpsD family peptidyl-prolyl cis-trans isomerase